MALPPQIIRIKRKKVDEPVDTLYLESQSPSKRRVTEQHITFRRLKDNDGSPVLPKPYSLQDNRQPLPITQARDVNGVPVVRATLPGEEEQENGRKQARQATNQPPSVITSRDPQQTAWFAAPTVVPLRHPPSLRRFHLSKSQSGSYPNAKASGSSGIQKRRRNPKKEIAVFEERTSPAKARNRDTRQRLAKALSDNFEENKLGDVAQRGLGSAAVSSLTRKKPGATAAEKQWRAQLKAQESRTPKDGVSKTQSQEELESASEISEYLANFALQEAQKNGPVATLPTTTQPRLAPKLAPKLKSMPKVPALRYSDRHAADNSAVATASAGVPAEDLQTTPTCSPPSSPPVTDSPVVEFEDGEFSESDYTYDTYMRDLEPVTLDSTDPKCGNTGVLVISEADQPLWETYVDGEDSDPEWSSDVDDENAENYYGADYPEDEVAPDDEYDVDAYKYGRDGVEDEGLGYEDEVAWSGDEHGRPLWETNPFARRPWQLKPAMLCSGDDEDDDKVFGI